MFDEYDEGTAILPAVALKRNLPSGGDFIALDADGDLSLPSDWYLKIAGFAAEVMRGQREVEKTLPRKMLLGDYWGSRKHGPATSGSGSSGSTATYVPKPTQAPAPQSSPAPVSTGAATPATTGSWQDVADIKEDEPPPPAYTLEAEEQASTLSATSTTPPPPPSVVSTTGGSGPNRANSVPTTSPTVTTQGQAGLGRSTSYSVSRPTPTSPIQSAAPWAAPPATHRFAPPPSAPPTSLAATSHSFTPPPTSLTPTPSHSPSPYNSAVATLSSDLSRMSTGSRISIPSSPPPSNSGSHTEFPLNWPGGAVQPQQYAHYTPPQTGHQSEHAHPGRHGSPSPPTTGWTAPVAAPISPPPGTHSLSNQYPHSSTPAPLTQTQQWGQPSGPPPTSCSSTAYMGNLGAPSPSPYQAPSSCPGTGIQPQPVHGQTPSNTSSYPNVQSPWHAPQTSTPNYTRPQQNSPPANQTGTPYGGQPQAGYFSGHTPALYAPPPGPPQPPQHPSTSGASGSGSSGQQTQPEGYNAGYPNKRTSHAISRGPILIRRADSIATALSIPTSPSGLYHDYSPRIARVPSLSNPGGFRLNILDYGRGTERPDAAFPGTLNTPTSPSGTSPYDSGALPQPGGFAVPESPSSPRHGTYTGHGPGVNPPWVGGFGTSQ